MALSSDYRTSIDVFSGVFLKEATEQPKNKGINIITSPLSADIGISMVGLGAEGETKKEITDALQVKNIDTITSSMRSTIDELNSAEGVNFDVVNKLYVKPATGGKKLDSIIPLYRSTIQNIFNSEVQQIDFSQSVAAASEINLWVKDKTHGHIDNLINSDSLSDLTAAIIINAIYFKGNWKKKFNAEYTRKQKFTCLDGSQVEVDMMYQSGHFEHRFSSELESQVLKLPYTNEDVSMVVILPYEVDGINKLIPKLANGTKKYTKDLYKGEIDVQFPRMLIKSTIDVKSVFQNLGVKRVFDSKEAEIKGILQNTPNLYVSDAIQKAVIEVNEEGAEAAAATGFEIVAESLPPQFRADHPFTFEIMFKDFVVFSGIYYGRD